MILGTGIDACEVERISSSIAKFGDRFLERIFTPAEIIYCKSKRNFAERFAARFAAKEAAMKALGTGQSRGVFWTSIEVGREPGGRPALKLHDAAARIAAAAGVKRMSLSLTHTSTQAIAMVIFED